MIIYIINTDQFGILGAFTDRETAEKHWHEVNTEIDWADMIEVSVNSTKNIEEARQHIIEANEN